MARYKMTKYRGDTYSISLNFTQNDLAVDITGWIIFYTVKNKITGTDGDAVISKTVDTHTNPTGGISLIEVDSADTEELAGDYHYDIQVRKTDGTIRTLVKDIIEFKEDVTLRVS